MKYTQTIVTDTLLTAIKASMDTLESSINTIILSKENSSTLHALVEQQYANLAVLTEWYDRTAKNMGLLS